VRRLNIGPRLSLSFIVIILLMFGSDAVLLWQFHVVRVQTERLNGLEQKLVSVLRVHTSLLAFHDRLETLADAEDASQLVAEAGQLHAAVLEEAERARLQLGLLPSNLQRDPTILPTLEVIQSALQSQLEAITNLASSGDWRAVHLRLANQVHPLESLTSALVEKVDHEVGEEQAQTVMHVREAQRRVFLIVPVTVFFTILVAGTLGLAITRTITQPLARLLEASKTLARGEFHHQVDVTGNDELADLARVFNDTASQLRNLYSSLQDSEEQLRRVINTIPAHVTSMLPDGSVDFINQRLLEFTGYSIGALGGWSWEAVVHPDDRSRTSSAWCTALENGTPLEIEIRMRRADGEYRWFLARNVALRDDMGKIVKWYGTAIEIEDRKQAEEELRRSRAYLAEAQRLSLTGSFSWKVAAGEIVWSEQTYQIFGYDIDIKPTLRSVLQRTHPDDKAIVQQVLEQTTTSGSNFDVEHRLLMPDNTVKYLHVVARGLEDSAGNLELVGAVTDITSAKQAEEALRKSEEQWRDVFENNPTMYFMVDASGKIIAINPLGAEKLGYTIRELIAQPVLSVFSESDREAVTRNLALCFERIGQSQSWEARKVCKDGRIIRVREMAKAVPRASGPIALIACEDTTEQRIAEEALRQAQVELAHVNRVNTMGELTASLAHELTQPIAAAVTNASACVLWLSREHPNIEQACEAASRIVRDGRRAGEIISRIRQFFKRATPEWEEVDINTAILDTLTLMQNQAKEHDIAMHTELAPNLPPVMGDYVQLQQVLMNLIVNSIDALKSVEGVRELAIRSCHNGTGQILISVSDTGVGLPPNKADEIFRPFFTTKPHGIGMGLRICCSIVETHGGRLWAESNSPRGAIFYLTLPSKGEASMSAHQISTDDCERTAVDSK
jgi:PAS domain S-box-containing protein